MRAVLTYFLITGLLVATSSASAVGPQESPSGSSRVELSDLERLRTEGFNAVYNIDYKTARERFMQMTRLAPDHPAGYVYLANNVWLETLYQSRRLTTSVYTGGSFYSQDKDEDKVDAKRDRDFNDYIRQALAAARARLAKNPKDTEALYYNASALGIRAAYGTSVKRDPEYIDAYLSIGLYEYVIDSLPGGLKFLARLAGLKGSKQKGIEHLELVTQKGKYTADDARVVLLGIYSKENQLY